MRWKPLDPEGAVENCVCYPLMVITAPVWLSLIAMVWLVNLKKRNFGPHAEWAPWFAWHPVRTWNWESEPRESTVWLERVWRREYWGRVEYRVEPPAITSQPRGSEAE